MVHQITAANIVADKIQFTLNSLSNNYNPVAVIDWVGGLFVPPFLLVVGVVIAAASAAAATSWVTDMVKWPQTTIWSENFWLTTFLFSITRSTEFGCYRTVYFLVLNWHNTVKYGIFDIVYENNNDVNNSNIIYSCFSHLFSDVNNLWLNSLTELPFLVSSR